MSQRWNRHHFHLQKHSQWRQGSSTRRLRSFLTRCSLQNFKIELLFSKLLLLCISSNSGAACSRKVSCVRTSTSTYQLGTGQSMRDGETLVSVDGSFELGFFNPKTGTSRYLGVWYRDASRNPTVAWVANRERPLQSTSGLLKFSDKGIL
ncbi:hypothetical protein AAHE18_12G168300 [Arachis hypogaea]|uniref:Bulb-type lectin domain-containing protein n=1 Tax=Arachis hypogaea TaxID=3818 RepID=A0A445ALI4_ARAHY|nr:Putative G-type lectin S-receptor-like serine/threonine-protein kinase [Arachis hypogaea]RYR27210.1 hypothetical protein Ahy_B02g061555 isoform B [Arachis hypogaea]